MIPKRERNFLQALFANTEAVVDTLADNAAISAVPIVGTAFALCKGFDDLRSRALAAKLEEFLTDPAMKAGTISDKLKRKILADPEEANRVGETLFLVIDRLTDFEKPHLLAKAYVAYLDDDLSAPDLKRIARAIDLAFADDLFAFLNASESELGDRSYNPQHPTNSWLQHLETSGLTSSNVGRAPPGLARTRRAVTELGHTLRKVWKKYGTVA